VRGRGGSPWLWLSAALGLLLLGAGLIGVPSAQASGFIPKGAFGAPTPPSLTEPVGMTVDPASGDVLVIDVAAKTISRFKPDGSADNFSALSGNVIDGLGGPDETPAPHGLNPGTNPREVQLAVAPPGAAGGTAGDIYLVEPGEHLVDVFAPSGEWIGRLTEFKEGANASGSPKALNLTAGVAVDPAGAIYVSAFDGTSAGEVHKYVPTSNSPFTAANTANFSRPSFGHVAAGAGLTNGFIFAAKFGSEPFKIDSEGAEEGTAKYPVTAESSLALAVNPVDGDLFSASESEVKEYDASGSTAPVGSVRSFAPSGGGLRGIAVDGARDLVYVSREGLGTIEVWEKVKVPSVETLPASPVGHESATLRGKVNPNGQPLTECLFEWGESTAYGNVAPCEAPNAAEVGAGSAFVEVHADLELEAGTAYHFRFVAGNANTPPGEGIKGEDEAFKTTGPQVRGEEASQVTATAARIGATIDPNEEETEFFVQYLTEAAFLANPEEERFAAAARVPLADRKVPAAVTGTGNITSGSLIVKGAIASSGAFGPGETITGPGIPAATKIESLPSPTELKLSQAATATTPGVALSASGPQPVGQLIGGLTPQTVYRFRLVAHNAAATTDGQAKALTTPALPGEEACANAALRQGAAAGLPDCRAYEMVSPPHKAGEVIAPEPRAELGGSCVSCLPGAGEQMQPMQSAPGGDSVLYVGQPFSAGQPAGPNEYLGGRGSGGWGSQGLSPLRMTGKWEAFSADLSRGVLSQTEPPLSPAAPSRGGAGFADLYLSAGGALEPLLTEEPPHRDAGTPNSAGANAFGVRYAGANSGTAAAPALTHVVFEANDALTPATGVAPAAPEVSELASECAISPCDLYEWSGGQLGLVNVAPGNAAALGRAAIGSGRLLEEEAGFETPDVDHAVSADGRRVFWSSEETGQAYARVDGDRTLEIPGPGSCKKSVTQSSRACFLTAAADGSEVLLSNGQLYELNGAGSAYEPSTDLAAGEGGFQGILGASEDLSRIYFVDTAALTPPGEENANEEHAVAGAFNLYAFHEGATAFIGALLEGDNQLGFSFGAWKASPADRIAQASPDGRFLAFMSKARLSGYDNTRAGGGDCALNGGGPTCFEVFEYAADTGTLSCASCNPAGQRPLGRSNLSLLKPTGSPPAFPQPANLSPAGNGRLFFESRDSLLPQDTNAGIQDVYEWEPAGIGGCAKAGGCVALISSGHSSEDSMFMDASANGDDAFFITRSQLVAGDQDSQLDLYDARVGGGFAEEAAAACAGEACKGPISQAPAQPSAGSSSFAGPGNPKPAKKAARQKKHAKHKHKKQTKHKRAARHDRGARR
jgi:hypothetical protein